MSRWSGDVANFLVTSLTCYEEVGDVANKSARKLRGKLVPVEFELYNVFAADTLRDAVTLTFEFDPLILKLECLHSIDFHSVPNFSEIEQSAAELLRVKCGHLGRRLPS